MVYTAAEESVPEPSDLEAVKREYNSVVQAATELGTLQASGWPGERD